jgi:bifunctional UDP-N-acetylglucosamine pyrophosphorylase/glucosamine-1-phosphate N-acetyltransferase
MGQQPAPLAVIVLAAGKGTRMKSGLVKVLHEVAGRPMLGHVLAAVEALSPERTVVVIGRDGDAVAEAFAGQATFVEQGELRGTGHAVQQTETALADFRGDVLVLYGDVPLLRAETLQQLRRRKAAAGAPLAMLTSSLPLPGIVMRDSAGRVARIVEVTDATPAELAIREFNTGVYLVDADLLWKAIAKLDDSNAQSELYLTDIVAGSVAAGRAVEAVCMEDPDEALGVNTRSELARAGSVLRRRTAERLMEAGVTIVDPDHTWIDVDVEIGCDSRIDPGVVISGRTLIGERVHVKAHCVIESSRLEHDVVVGPSAHIRPGCHLGRGVRVGNYVEVKNSELGEGVKADHLAYIGDADVGAGASFGCGAIVVNYDGVAKHRTRVGERAFVGCNSNLIAPVVLDDDSYVAAGSTVTQDVPVEALAVGRARQRNVEGWVRRRGTAAQQAASKAREDRGEGSDAE